MPKSRPHKAKTARARSSAPATRRARIVPGDFPVVAIGASAGGLDAYRKLLAALPDGTGMAYILIQHLDPNHASMMVELLSGSTSMQVQQATVGMRIERDADYILSGEKVSLILPFTRLPVQLDTWIWKVPVGHAMETKIGLLVQRAEQDQLRFSLLRRSSPSGNQPWQNTPTVFALDRESGEVQHFDQTLSDKDFNAVELFDKVELSP